MKFSIKKTVRRFFKYLGILILLILLTGIAFLNLSPQFGGKASKEQKEEYAQTGHYSDGQFLNDEEIDMQMDCHSLEAMINEMLVPDPNLVPDHDLEVLSFDTKTIVEDKSMTRVTWLGHSSFLIEFEGKVILLDPVFGQYASPHPYFGRPRFFKKLPFEVKDLAHVDLVIISHDHYDHLDYPSIKEMKDKVDHFFVPLGIGNHLKRWKVEEEKISEFDWWDEELFEGLKIACTPSRHMSGRGLTDQSATLWASWVIQGKEKNLYFSGDGGYGEHFKTIGQKYGPFDIGLMECGQYNDLWKDVHMTPEQSVQASMDLGTELIIPIHWGAFALATHSWVDPVERITAEAARLDRPIATPKIGESVIVKDSLKMSFERWWEEIES